MQTKTQPWNPYHVFDDMLEGVQIIDSNWRYFYVNKALAAQGKSTVEGLIGETMMEKYPGIEKTDVFRLIEQCMKERSSHCLLNEFEFPDQSKGYFELRIRPVPEGVLILSMDITEQKRLEHKLLQFNEFLEDMVNEQTRQLADSLEREKRLNELKSQFVATASHELKTPLAAIEVSINVLDAYNVPPKNVERQKFHGYIRTSVKDLHQILDDYLSLHRIEQGLVYQDDHQKIDLLEFIRGLVEKLEITYKPGQHINFQHTGIRAVSINSHTLGSILTNLLSNAIKYSDKPVDLSTYVKSGSIFLKVSDRGIGIPKDEQGQLFTKFFRAKNTSDIPGTGLGLNIVKRYVEFFDGKINFSSEENVGTTIEIELPNVS